MQRKLENQEIDNAAELLQSFIQQACDLNISRLKISAKSKS